MAARATAPRQRVWTVMDVIRASGEYLDGKGLEHGRLDAEHLLAHVLDMSRLHLYLHFDRPLSVDERGRLRPLLRRRGAREPLQYILGSAPFRHLVLGVDRRVAIPRPETEYLIDVLQRAAGPDRVFESALDVGTGSGAIALALASEGLSRSVTATDISAAALAAARDNAAGAGVTAIDFREGPLLEPVAGRTFDLVLSNPPYLTEEEWRSAQPEVREWEPRTAMVAGADGLDVIRGLVGGLDDILRPGGWVGLEVGNSQTDTVVHMLEAVPGLDGVSVDDDLTGRPRYVLGRKTGKPRSRPIA
ncbi:MAG: peptide chain release factor N(5)-glutamine methyltransferase [Gemmatimonadota bacterium]|nr:peptide chain release factor N(5)-glutamine methyltransferase [Gemmatimonadota bacterium]